MPAFLPLSLPTDSNATVPASNVTSSNATSNFAPLTNLNELTPNVSTNQFNATGNISLPVATMTSSPLQTVAVSQNLSVLTPTQQSTNTQSLTAFAQSMGLDDNAIAQLLSKAQAPQTPNANSGLSTNAITLASGTQTLTNTNTSPSAITPSSTLMAALSMQGHNGNATLAGSSTIMLQATPPTALPPNTASVPMAHQLLNAGNQFSNSGAAANVTSPPINTNSTIPLATNIPPNSANLTITAATSPQVQMAAYNVGTTASVKTDQGALDSESTVIDTGLSESDLPKLSASLGIELPVISATPAQTDTGAQSGSNSSNNPASLMGMGTEATQSNTSNTAQSSEASASISDIDQQEKYDQLNTRLATEMASRINQQLSAGQWKMKFGLRPANLGGVEVQLEMSDGKLNANFNAENPTTANLLQNASAHLRSSLENFGIQAGQVQVGTNAGGGQQNPSQQSPNTSQFVDNSGVQENSSQEETTEQPTSGRQDSSSGLDLYA
jgi:flagellar hook-length control protein FliK